MYCCIFILNDKIILWKMLSNDRPCLIFTDFLKLVCINFAINNNCYRTWSISADTSPNHRTHPCTTTETILHCGIHYSPGLGHKYTRVFSSMTVFHSSEKNTRFQLLSSIKCHFSLAHATHIISTARIRMF